MYRRLIILTVIIALALAGLTVLGYHAIEKWAESAKWKQFAEVAEQIRRDVERKLDDFIETEQQRPYTDYRYYYLPENITNAMQQMPVRSPLGGTLEHGLAYGHFQIKPDLSIITTNDDIVNLDGDNDYNFKIQARAEAHRWNVRHNLVPSLAAAPSGSQPAAGQKKGTDAIAVADQVKPTKADQQRDAETQKKRAVKGNVQGRRVKTYPIDLFQRQQRDEQVIIQDSAVYNMGINTNAANPEDVQISFQDDSNAQALTHPEQNAQQANQQPQATREQTPASRQPAPVGTTANAPQVEAINGRQQQPTLQPREARQYQNLRNADIRVNWTNRGNPEQQVYRETVRVRIKPFQTIFADGGDAENSAFGKQIFLVRDVQIEDQLFRQGFLLNEKRLIEEVKRSAASFVRQGMSFDLPQTRKERTDNGDVAYTAVLDFGFGYLILYLTEAFPKMIVRQATQLRYWYLSIVAVVFLAVALALLSLYRHAGAQLKLAEKKDDFISAVSHELRTPLTSIRMYAEMLENNWVTSQDKLVEYYRSVRQESERLSRLIENVLDFSRIQKDRKKYSFSLGDLNQCVAAVVEMMRPYASQHGFSLKTELGELSQVAFDADAVKQIVVNLLDNAVKYARAAEDKIITVRTKSDTKFVLIEVEDHGPGIPHRQRKKIFEDFYRLGSEATRETTGTGLGLALVKKFAQAHHGFVEILNAKPAGAIFRVGLAMQS
ncbi:MAG: sensor histidine kinase [Planctomycetota bacterium]|jgi:signal transduction histidine kinase